MLLYAENLKGQFDGEKYGPFALEFSPSENFLINYPVLQHKADPGLDFHLVTEGNLTVSYRDRFSTGFEILRKGETAYKGGRVFFWVEELQYASKKSFVSYLDAGKNYFDSSMAVCGVNQTFESPYDVVLR